MSEKKILGICNRCSTHIHQGGWRCAICDDTGAPYVCCDACKVLDPAKHPFMRLFMSPAFYVESVLTNIKIKNTPYKFLHIPKNAGNWFVKNYANIDYSGHKYARDFHSRERRLLVAIVRNPFDRAVSAYKWVNTPASYYHGIDKQSMGAHGHYNEAKHLTFKEYIKRLQGGEMHWTLTNERQIKFLTDDGSATGDISLAHLLRYEDLSNEISTKLKLTHPAGSSSPRNKSQDGRHWKTFYDEEARQMVVALYTCDFKRLGYSTQIDF